MTRKTNKQKAGLICYYISYMTNIDCITILLDNDYFSIGNMYGVKSQVTLYPIR
jgi:hypothetical protein